MPTPDTYPAVASISMLRRVAVPVLLAAVLAAVPATGSGAATDTGADAVTADKTGWWNSLQGVESGTPAAPISGVYPGFPQQGTGVAAGDFASALRAGETDKVSAVGITIDAPTGATVEEFTMTLTESGTAGSNNSSAALGAIKACPIVAFWAEVENGRFNGAPEANCELLSVPGERSEEGAWKFDLKQYGQLVLAGAGGLGEFGVLLLPEGSVPETWQVTWAGLASETPPKFTFRATGGSEEESGFGSGGFTGGTDFGSGDSGFDSGGDFGAVTFGDDIRSDTFDSGSAQADPPAEGGDADAGVVPDSSGPVDSSLGAEIGNIAGNLPPFALLGFLGLLAVFAVVGLALSRPPRTTEALSRRGGVSRALAARRSARPRQLETT